jgi:hypothetical protein
MFICKFTVSVITVTQEHQFSTTDRHGRDTYEILHYLKLVLNCLITIFGIKGTISIIQSHVLNLTLSYSPKLNLNPFCRD